MVAATEFPGSTAYTVEKVGRDDGLIYNIMVLHADDLAELDRRIAAINADGKPDTFLRRTGG